MYFDINYRLCKDCSYTIVGIAALHCDEYRTFWIRKEFNIITVGLGNTPGENIVVYYYHSTPYQPRYISISSSTNALWIIRRLHDLCDVTSTATTRQLETTTTTPEPTTIPMETTSKPRPTTDMLETTVVNEPSTSTQPRCPGILLTLSLIYQPIF